MMLIKEIIYKIYDRTITGITFMFLLNVGTWLTGAFIASYHVTIGILVIIVGGFFALILTAKTVRIADDHDDYIERYSKKTPTGLEYNLIDGSES